MFIRTVEYLEMTLDCDADLLLYYLDKFCCSLTILEHCIFLQIPQGAEGHCHGITEGLSSQGDLD